MNFFKKWNLIEQKKKEKRKEIVHVRELTLGEYLLVAVFMRGSKAQVLESETLGSNPGFATHLLIQEVSSPL